MGHVWVLHRLLLNVLQRCNTLGQAKVAEPYILIVIKKDIFWFDISVNNLSLMQVIDSFEYLPVNLPLELFVGTAGIFLKKLLQRLSVTILHLNVQYPYALLPWTINVFALGLGSTIALLVLETLLLGRKSTFILAFCLG